MKLCYKPREKTIRAVLATSNKLNLRNYECNGMLKRSLTVLWQQQVPTCIYYTSQILSHVNFDLSYSRLILNFRCLLKSNLTAVSILSVLPSGKFKVIICAVVSPNDWKARKQEFLLYLLKFYFVY